jgi:hypothetical protein
MKVLWSDGGEADHCAQLISYAGALALRVVRLGEDGRRTSHYVPLSLEQRAELATALLSNKESS